MAEPPCFTQLILVVNKMSVQHHVVCQLVPVVSGVTG